LLEQPRHISKPSIHKIKEIEKNEKEETRKKEKGTKKKNDGFG
jgi:hypothetical protein